MEEAEPGVLGAQPARGFFVFRLKVPGGMLIGSVIGAWVLSMAAPVGPMPYGAKFLAQVTAGAFIGAGMQRSDLKYLKTLFRPLGISIFSFLVLNLVIGTLLHVVCGMDLKTALFCCIPGGLSDVPLIAADAGADVAVVTVAQFCRLVMGIGVFPSLINRMGERQEAEEETTSEGGTQRKKGSSSSGNSVLILLVAGICGGIGRYARVPAGVLLFAMIGTLIFNLIHKPVKLPRSVRRAAQCLSGAYIGCSVGPEAVNTVLSAAVPILIILFGYLANACITGHIISRKLRISIKESMLMVTPAGASDMALISADLGVHSPTLVLLQVCRMLIAVSVFPFVDLFWAGLFA